MTAKSLGVLCAEAELLLKDLKSSFEDMTVKRRLAIPQQEMPAQEASERRKNVAEVTLGYGEAQARVESMRCLQCKNAPCIDGCPVRINIPAFIKAISDGDDVLAIRIIRESSLLPAVCGRVCPQEGQCQKKCTVGVALRDVGRAVAIGRLERFVADKERERGSLELPPIAAPTGKKVAVVGSGPAGLTVAADVRRAGHEVTVFEAFHKAGGVLMYGIPEFRLPKEIVRQEVANLVRMGVKFELNFVVGRTRKLLDLLRRDGFDAVFIGTGAGLPKFMGIPGEQLVGVYSANEYLTRANLMRAYDREKAATPIMAAKRVAVLGGGNVALDAARMALRLGAERVFLIYRRTEKEMPARREEVEHAREEGVEFNFLQNVRQIVGTPEGIVNGVECLQYELGAPDASGRPRPVEIPDSGFFLPVDAVIVAIGNEANPLIKQTTQELAVDQAGHIVVDRSGAASIEGIYAGGDIVLGAATVILAMGEGRRSAAAINKRLSDL